MQESQQIHIGKIIEKKRGHALPRPITRILEKLIHEKELNYILDRYGHLEGVDFMTALVEKHFKVKIQWEREELLPDNGRCLFVSNHPLGGLDGICLSHLIGQHYQSEVRYIVNDILFNLKPLRKIFVPVNTRGKQKRENINQLYEAFQSNFPVITFPAGFCSRLIDGNIQDTPWKKSFVQLAHKYERDIVPLFFDGLNSKRFYKIEQIRKKLGIKFNIGTALLPDEMFRSKGQSFRVFVGEPIPWQTLSPEDKGVNHVARIRSSVYALKPNDK